MQLLWNPMLLGPSGYFRNLIYLLMKTFTQRLFILVLFIVCLWSTMLADNKTVNSITITQVDTFALQGMAAQPVLKININVIGTDGSLSFQKLLVHTLNDYNTDVDSAALYYSDINNRFSLIDYPGEAFLLGHRRKIAGDTAAFSIAYNLQTGDNYFWVTMDLNSGSRASHVLRAYVPANGITIASIFYPPTQSITAKDTIAQIYFRDNFENYTIGTRSLMYPVGWDQSPTPNNTYFSWHNNNGGYSISTVGYPAAAKSGKYNLLVNKVGYQPDSTVVYKQIDLSLASHPKLTFYHAQAAWCKDIACADKNSDKLRVKYKIGTLGAWHEIAMYRLETDDWTKREIFLPTTACVSNCILGFEGIVQFGWGVVVDSVIIYETHVINKGIHDVAITQPNLTMIPQGASKNPILRMNIRVKGNTGNVILNSINVTSGNTLDTDIAPGGVKLFYTPDSIFVDPVQLGSGLNFSGGVASFTGLNKLLETGENFIWVTYDVSTNAYPGHVLDASIRAGGISLTQGNYPPSDDEGSPDGSRLVKQTVFFDDFESAAWIMTGEFQIGPPLGKGGAHFGMPDPTSAYSGSNVLGTDLTGTGANPGDYEPNLSADAYSATSPLIDGRYFKNIQFDFFRYLNVDNTDSASIEYQLLNETSWQKLWTSKKKYVESKWRDQSVPTNQLLDRKKFKIRFALGPTDNIDNYSGWNIDYLFLTGDSIPIDAAMGKLVSPVSSCNLKANEHVQVYVKNVGPNPLINTPIRLSIDGGRSYVTETIPGPVLPDD